MPHYSIHKIRLTGPTAIQIMKLLYIPCIVALDRKLKTVFELLSKNWSRKTRLTEQQRQEIIIKIKSGLSKHAVAREYNITYQSILGLLKRRNIQI